MIPELTGVVLAGGRSSRFGASKALADWNGAALIETVTKSLLQHMPEVLIVTKDAQSFDFLKADRVKIVRDLYSEGHPLGGIYTALRSIKTSHAFVRACDMPFLQDGLVEKMWTSRAHFDAVIPVWQGARQPLCGIYTPACGDTIRASIDKGELSIASLFDRLQTRFCLEGEVSLVDPQGHSFMDIDTQEDYERAKEVRPC